MPTLTATPRGHRGITAYAGGSHSMGSDGSTLPRRRHALALGGGANQIRAVRAQLCRANAMPMRLAHGLCTFRHLHEGELSSHEAPGMTLSRR